MYVTESLGTRLRCIYVFIIIHFKYMYMYMYGTLCFPHAQHDIFKLLERIYMYMYLSV